MSYHPKYVPKAKRERRAAKKIGQAERPQPAVKVYKISGREVCSKTPEGKAEYALRLDLMCIRQDWLCGCGCGLYMTQVPDRFNTATFDHEDGRGSGGGHRDDRIVKDGKPYNRALRYICNGNKGSKRGYENSGVRTERTGRFTL
jgi:hypothetical protein